MPIGLTVANQRGGVGKTTTVLTLASCLADGGKRVLLIDTDSQGSVYITTGCEPKGYLHQLVGEGMALSEVVTQLRPGIDVVASDRRTQRLEATLAAQTAKEMVFHSLLRPADKLYDIVLFDVAPSISHLQACAVAYSKNVLIPVAMDILSVEGARASLETIAVLNEYLNLGCKCIGFLPTRVDRRMSATEVVMGALASESDRTGIPVLHPIRTDEAINKAQRNLKFLKEYDPRSKALEDYQAACDQITAAILSKADGQKA